MKFLCTGCNRLLDVEKFRIDGATLIVTCVCGTENRATATASTPAPAPAPAPARPVATVTALRTPTVEAISRAGKASLETNAFAVPDGYCIKCISKKTPLASACSTCGLSYAASATAFQPSPWLQGEWLTLLGTWGDDRAHEALRVAAMNQGELAEVGRLYRLRLADTPDDPYASRGRDEVLRLAVLPSLTARQLKPKSGDEKVPTWKYVALGLVILGSLMVLMVMVRQMLSG